MNQEIECRVTISRVSGGGKDDTIRISIEDVNSSTTFVVGKMNLKDFASAITGQGHMPLVAEVYGLQNVGKQRVREQRQAKIPANLIGREYLDRNKVKDYLMANFKEDGWDIDPYLGSQNSIQYLSTEDIVIVNYAVVKYG